MSPTARLLEVTDALTEAGLQLLIMGGHAVRHYGVDRNTFDFDFHVSADSAGQLEDRLRRTRLFSGGELKEGVSWRRDDFRRFQIGVLPNDREEWLEFWFRNHLLAPSDVRLLEEVLDARNLANATGPAGPASALAQLRSRRGFETAEAQGLFRSHEQVRESLERAAHPVTCAYLLPFAPDAEVRGLDSTADAILRRLQPGSARHLAIVEAVRLAYQRAAKAADHADKERHQVRTQNPT